MLAGIERLFSTVTTVLVNARKTGDGVMEKEERGEQTEEDDNERKMFTGRTKATETWLMYV